MSRVFTDDDLVAWEAYASGGKFGLPEQPKIVFNCLSDPNRRPRFVIHEGQNAEAQEAVKRADDDLLREMLGISSELD
jgi:hypothetical protein